MNEPLITVNGQPLSEGEAMTIRVALNAFLQEMTEPAALGDDEHGKAMAAGYQKCARATLLKMMPQKLHTKIP